MYLKYKLEDVVVLNQTIEPYQGFSVGDKVIIKDFIGNPEEKGSFYTIKNTKNNSTLFVDDSEIDHQKTEQLKNHKSKSLRFNEGKPEFSHLSPQFILEMSKLMTKSAEKYTRQNWCLKQDLVTAGDSLFRHYAAFMSGQDVDEGGSNMSHLLHIAVNAMIMWENYEQYGEEVDTRFYKTLKEKLDA